MKELSLAGRMKTKRIGAALGKIGGGDVADIADARGSPVSTFSRVTCAHTGALVENPVDGGKADTCRCGNIVNCRPHRFLLTRPLAPNLMYVNQKIRQAGFHIVFPTQPTVIRLMPQRPENGNRKALRRGPFQGAAGRRSVAATASPALRRGFLDHGDTEDHREEKRGQDQEHVAEGQDHRLLGGKADHLLDRDWVPSMP